MSGPEPTPPLPLLILDELAGRLATLHEIPGSPWTDPVTVLRHRPHEEHSPAPGQVRIVAETPRPVVGWAGQVSQRAWTMDVTVSAYMPATSEHPPEAGPDTRPSIDQLGLGGLDAMLTLADPDAIFGSEDYPQLCDLVEFLNPSYGQTDDGAHAGCSMTLRFTFQTSARSWRDFAYPHA